MADRAGRGPYVLRMYKHSLEARRGLCIHHTHEHGAERGRYVFFIYMYEHS